MSGRHWIALALILAAPMSSARAAEIGGQIDRDTIDVGDTILFTVRAATAESAVFSAPPAWNASPFEVRSMRVETSPVELDARIELQIFEPGDKAIPPFAVFYAAGETGGVLSTDTFVVHVRDVLAPDDTELRDIIDIREPIRSGGRSRLLLALAALALIFLGILVWRRLRRVAGALERTGPPSDPYEAFLARMAEVDLMLASPFARMKDVYSVMTEAVKRIVLDKESVDTTGLTTTETLDDPSILRWPKNHFDELKRLLQAADFVKFAKMTPAIEEAKADEERVLRWIAERYAPRDDHAVR